MIGGVPSSHGYQSDVLDSFLPSSDHESQLPTHNSLPVTTSSTSSALSSIPRPPSSLSPINSRSSFSAEKPAPYASTLNVVYGSEDPYVNDSTIYSEPPLIEYKSNPCRRTFACWYRLSKQVRSVIEIVLIFGIPIVLLAIILPIIMTQNSSSSTSPGKNATLFIKY